MTRGFCDHCGGAYALRKDGTVRAHRYFVAGQYTATMEPCPGAGKAPSPRYPPVQGIAR